MGNPTLFLKAHWIFSTATFLPNKHNLSFNTSSIQRVFLISAKPPSPSPEYKLSVWALWLKKGQESIFQLEKCRPLKLKTPGILLQYCCEKKQCAQKRQRLQRRGREEMGRQSSCQVQTEIVFWKISLWKIHHYTHTKKKKTGKKSFPIQVQLSVWNIRDTEKMTAVLGGYQSMSSSTNCIKMKWWKCRAFLWKKVKFCI